MNPETELVAVGDSAMWGMGLDHSDKYVTKFYEYLTGETLPETNLKAQTGAVIGHTPTVMPVAADLDWAEDERLSIAQKHGRNSTERYGRKGVGHGAPTIPQQIRNLPYDYDQDRYAREDPMIMVELNDDVEYGVEIATTDDEGNLRDEDDLPISFETVATEFLPPSEIGPANDAYAATYGDESDVDIVVMNGSINDVGATRPVHGTLTNLQEELDADAQTFSYQGVRTAIDLAHEKFPEATIMVCGYFPPASRESNLLDARVIDTVTTVATILGGVPLATLWRAYVRAWKHRYEYMYKKMTFEMRRAVRDRDAALDVPILFVLPGFKRENAIHADDPWLFGLPGGEQGIAEDVADAISVPGSPDVGDLLTGLIGVADAFLNPNYGDQAAYREDARDEAIDVSDDTSGVYRNATAHPNPTAAEQYYQVMKDVYERNFVDGWNVRDVCSKLRADDADGPIDVRESLERYQLDPSDGLRESFNMTKIDSMEVVIETGDDGLYSGWNEVTLDVGLRDSFNERTGRGSDQYVARFNLNPHRSHPAINASISDLHDATVATHGENRIRGQSNTVERLALDPIFDDLEILSAGDASNISERYEEIGHSDVEGNDEFTAEEPLYLWDIKDVRIARTVSGLSWGTRNWDIESMELWINGERLWSHDDHLDLRHRRRAFSGTWDFTTAGFDGFPGDGGGNPIVVFHGA